MIDPLDGISIFVAVAEASSISEAARRLGLSKSAVSEGISRFESRLGARLLTRSSRGLVVRKLAPTRILLCASPDYLKQRGAPDKPQELARHDCLRFTALPWSNAWPFIGADGPVTIPIASRLSSDGESALKAAALAGAGLSLFPAHQIEAELRAGTLVPVLTDRLPQAHAIYAVYPSNRLIAAKVRTFVELLARDLKREIIVRPGERRVRTAVLPRRSSRA